MGADVTKNLSGDNPVYVDYVITRLHYRYTRDSLGDDLVFKVAPALVGGRGIPDTKGALPATGDSQGVPSDWNNFQGRYIILHPWDKALTCSMPVRGRWGGPSGAAAPMSMAFSNTALQGSPATAGDLSALLAESISGLDVVASMPLQPLPPLPTVGSGGSGGAKAGGGAAAHGGTTGNTAGDNAAGAAGSTASPEAGCSCQLVRSASQPSPLAAVGGGLFCLAWLRRVRRRDSRRS